VITRRLIDRNVKFTRLLCLPKAASSSNKLLLVAVLAILGALAGCADAHLPLLTSIQVTPANSTLDIGQTQQFTAVGTFSDGSSKDLTSLVTWSSSNTTVATISSSGLALGQGKGSSMISALFNTADGPVTGATSVGVIVTLKSLTITPANPSIANGTNLQMTATGIFSDGSTQDLTSSASWTSSSGAIATVSSSGLLTGTGVGSATITATQAGVSSGATTVTVTAAVLTSITITPPNFSVANGTRKQITATGNFSDGTTQDLTTSVTWASSVPLATVSNAAGSQGLVMGSGKGIATISATLGTVSGATMITVTNAVLTSIAVAPANSSIANGTTERLTATGFYSDGSTQDLTTQVSWASSSDMMATVSGVGLVTGTGVGSPTMTATFAGVSGSAAVTVTTAVLTSLTVTPANTSIPVGTGEQLIATGMFSDGTSKDLTTSVTWGSSDTTLAIVSSAAGTQGFVTGTGMGGVTISAVLPGFPGVTGSASVTVTAMVLISIAVSPANPSISNGATVPLTATGTFSDGSTKDLTTQVSWTSSSDTTAHVDNTPVSPGLVTGTGEGSATITATLSGVSGATTMTVTLTCDIGVTTTAYNAIPFGAVNCAPVNNEAFQAQQISEFGNAVTLATGTGRTLVSLNVLFASYGCGVSGFWSDPINLCVTDPANPTFQWPITANIYANACPGPTPCLGSLLATVTQTQTIPFRPSADPTCPDPTKFRNSLNTISPGGCQSNIRAVLTFTGFTLSTGVTTLPNDVIWTVAFNTSNYGLMPMPCGNSNPGCGYDSLNVGAQSFTGAPYAGTNTDPNGAFLNSLSPGAYCPNTTGGTGVLRLDTGCWGPYTPLGEVITQ
jgi:uncharacterized protein YjdB